jgi:hypothetical protein
MVVLGVSYSKALIWRYVGVATHSRQQLRHMQHSAQAFSIAPALSIQHSALCIQLISTRHSAQVLCNTIAMCTCNAGTDADAASAIVPCYRMASVEMTSHNKNKKITIK